MESVKVEVVKNEYYPYPDIVLTCDPTDNNNQLVKNPVLIVEVTSKSTAANDRSFKWAHYRKIPSLCYYLLVSQDEVMVEMFSRNGSSHLWTFQDFTSPDDVILLDTLSYQLPVKAIYELIRFEEE